MERIVEESQRLEEGLHQGVIIAVEERTTPPPNNYKYIDLVIEIGKITKK